MLKLSIVTPNGLFLEKECASVSLPGTLGDMQILVGHTPVLSELKEGLVEILDKNNLNSKFNISHGFAEVDNNCINILCTTVSSAD